MKRFMFNKEMDEWLKENYLSTPTSEIVDKFNEHFGTSTCLESIRKRANLNGLKKKPVSHSRAYKYTEEMDAWLIEKAPFIKSRDLPQAFLEEFGVKISQSALGKHEHKVLGLKKQGHGARFTKEQIQWLRDNHEGLSAEEITDMYNSVFHVKRDSNQIRCICHKYGIQIFDSDRVRRLMQSKNTRHEVGTLKVTSDGYTYIKVRHREFGKPKSQAWELYHRYLYRTHIGEIPDGMSVAFLDGDRTNFELSNLALCSKRVAGKLRSVEKYGDTEIGRTWKAIFDVEERLGETNETREI